MSSAGNPFIEWSYHVLFFKHAQETYPVATKLYDTYGSSEAEFLSLTSMHPWAHVMSYVILSGELHRCVRRSLALVLRLQGLSWTSLRV